MVASIYIYILSFGILFIYINRFLGIVTMLVPTQLLEFYPGPGVVLQLRLKTRFGSGLSLTAGSTSQKNALKQLTWYHLLGGTWRPRNAKKYEKKDAAGENRPGRSERAQAPKRPASSSARKRAQAPGDSKADPGSNAGPSKAKKAKKPKKWSVLPWQVCGICGEACGKPVAW